MNYYTANSCFNYPADTIIIQRIQEVNQISVSVEQPWATGSPPAFTIIWEHCVRDTRSKWTLSGHISTVRCWLSYCHRRVFLLTTGWYTADEWNFFHIAKVSCFRNVFLGFLLYCYCFTTINYSNFYWGLLSDATWLSELVCYLFECLYRKWLSTYILNHIVLKCVNKYLKCTWFCAVTSEEQHFRKTCLCDVTVHRRITAFNCKDQKTVMIYHSLRRCPRCPLGVAAQSHLRRIKASLPGGPAL